MERYKSVLDDIEWLTTEWWHDSPESLSSGHLRRGSTTLHLLLVQGLLAKVWRAYGFQHEPKLIAPDLSALMIEKALSPHLTIGCIAGGACQKGVMHSFIGAFRVDNPSTGTRADADEGFAVQVVTYAVKMPSTDFSLLPPVDDLTRSETALTKYLNAKSAIYSGGSFSRKQIIEYFRNYKGGAHADLADPFKNRREKNKSSYQALDNLDRQLFPDHRRALYFELLSIGQAVATAPDIWRLVNAMKKGKPVK